MGVKLIKRRFPSGAVNLYLDVNYNGMRNKESLHLSLNGDRLQNRETIIMAEEIRARREIMLLQQRHGIIHAKSKKGNFVEYVERLIQSKASVHTKKSWQNALNHFVAFAGDVISFGALTSEHFDEFKSYLMSQVSQNSAQIYFSRIKTALYGAVKEGILAANPAAFINIRKQEQLPVHLTLGELQQLANTPCPNADVRAAFLFACFTGLRYSDIVSLTWDQTDGEYLEFTQKKTSAPLRLPLAAEAKSILGHQRSQIHSKRVKHCQPDNAIFLLPRQSTVDKELKQWSLKAGLTKRLSMHKARHTFATMSLASGNDIYTTAKLLGHKNLQTTQIYAKVIDETKRKAVGRFPRLMVHSNTQNEIENEKKKSA